MAQTHAGLASNDLISALPVADRRRLLALSEPVQLVAEVILCAAGAVIRDVYFPTTGFISLVACGANQARLEVGLVGNEGMFGSSLALGVDMAQTLVQVQGTGVALQLGAKAFKGELERSRGLQRMMQRYLYVSMCQLTQTALCTRFHVVEARLAKWLLMTADRAHSREFHLTHEFLAYMLGVRRAGVTRAASALSAQGLIGYRRGNIEILDRPGLERAACECYRKNRESYSRTMA